MSTSLKLCPLRTASPCTSATAVCLRICSSPLLKFACEVVCPGGTWSVHRLWTAHSLGDLKLHFGGELLNSNFQGPLLPTLREALSGYIQHGSDVCSQSARVQTCKTSSALRTKNSQATVVGETALVLQAEEAEGTCPALCMKSHIFLTPALLAIWTVSSPSLNLCLTIHVVKITTCWPRGSSGVLITIERHCENTPGPPNSISVDSHRLLSSHWFIRNFSLSCPGPCLAESAGILSIV